MHHLGLHMSHAMRKPDFCLCENKGAAQLRSNCKADQRLCFCYMTIPLLPKSEISSFSPFSETVQTGLCWTCTETPKTGFITSQLICSNFRRYWHSGQDSGFENEKVLIQEIQSVLLFHHFIQEGHELTVFNFLHIIFCHHLLP